MRHPLLEVTPITEDAQEAEAVHAADSQDPDPGDADSRTPTLLGSILPLPETDPDPGVADSRTPIQIGSIQPTLEIRHLTKIRTGSLTHKIRTSLT